MGFLSDMKKRIKETNKMENELGDNFLNKQEKLALLFKDHDKLPVKQVLEETGILSEGSLRTYIWNLRKGKVIFLNQKFGFIVKEEKKTGKRK